MRISSCLCWCFYSPSSENQVGKNSQINKELEQKPCSTVEVDEVKLEVVEEVKKVVKKLESNKGLYDQKIVPINYDESPDEELISISFKNDGPKNDDPNTNSYRPSCIPK
jgi:hypothetical protein